MQKLQAKFKNTPGDTSLVPCSVSSGLNKVKKPSDQDKVRTCNNSEENHQQHRAGSGLRVLNIVYVLNKRGKALMPTCQSRARRLLNGNKAKVVKRFPFTIQLTEATGETKQNITLGIDSGYSHIGFSAVSDKQELVGGEVLLENKTKGRLDERRMYRRGRRNKLWYREARFDNRVKPVGWLPPSTQRRYDTHLGLVNRMKRLLPITKVVVEVGNFDIQKIDNPEIHGKKYQQGDTFGFFNVKAFVIAREQGKCQICGKEKGEDGWSVHHIIQRKDGGSDKQSNLALLHIKCHEKLHRSNSKLEVATNKTYKQPTFMNIVKEKFKKDLDCETTFGYITYGKRIAAGLKKSHQNDAFIVAGGSIQTRHCGYYIEQKRRNNRTLQLNRKGFKPSIRRCRYSCQPKDLVKANGKLFEVIGCCCYGKSVVVGRLKERLGLNPKKIDWTFHNNGLVFKQLEKRAAA